MGYKQLDGWWGLLVMKPSVIHMEGGIDETWTTQGYFNALILVITINSQRR